MSPETSNPVSPTPGEQAQLETLQAQLSDRASTHHFAHAGVSLVIALIVAGAAGKLFWDAKHFPVLGGVAAVFSLCIMTYSVVQYGIGRRHLQRELALFDSLNVLRHDLRLDDPAALLPQ